MPCERIGDAIICYNKAYKYKGYYFEWTKWGGPMPLRKDGEVRMRLPSGFYDMIDEFLELPEEEQEKYRDM